MNREEIAKRVGGIILGIDADLDMAAVWARPDEPLSDTADFDSLDYMSLALDIESAFGVEIPDDDSPHLKTINGIVGWLAAHAE